MSSIPSIYDMQKQIEERIKAARPAHVLYNPSDEWVEVMVNGSPIRIPPNGRSKGPDGKMHDYDGTVSVRDTYGVDPEVLRKARQEGKKRPDLPQNKVVLSALEAVSHAVRKRHARGIIFLTGDEATDGVEKVKARAVWIEYKKDQAERLVQNFRQQTATFHADPRNQGQPAPPMPEHIQRAQEFLDDYRLGKFDRKRFGCPINCGYYTDDPSRLETHVRASHPLMAKPAKAGSNVADEEPEPPQPTEPTEEPTPLPDEEEPEPEEPKDPSAIEGTVLDSPPKRGPGRPRKVPYKIPDE